jgi:hypothetical protein
MPPSERIRRIAERFAFTPTNATCIVKDGEDWWLLGCVEGDQKLPGVRSVWALGDVLDIVEAWLRTQERRKG